MVQGKCILIINFEYFNVLGKINSNLKFNDGLQEKSTDIQGCFPKMK